MGSFLNIPKVPLTFWTNFYEILGKIRIFSLSGSAFSVINNATLPAMRTTNKIDLIDFAKIRNLDFSDCPIASTHSVLWVRLKWERIDFVAMKLKTNYLIVFEIVALLFDSFTKTLSILFYNKIDSGRMTVFLNVSA